MKRILIALGLGMLMVLPSNALVISTNITANINSPAFVLLPTRASIYAVQLTATVPATVALYDQNTVAAPYFGTNYTTASYVTSASYATNLVTTFVGYNNITNYYTNSGTFTYSVTNAAATNALSPLGVFVVGANQAVTYNVDELHAKGITAFTTTNLSIVIFYRTAGQ